MKESVELYLHIPFCVRKCNYCDFLSFSADQETQALYMEKLKTELLYTASYLKPYTISSVFIGGGTPSAVSERYIDELMFIIRECFDLDKNAEISIECNPGSTLRHKFAVYRRAGINRISLGLQSADNAELRMLGRVHCFEEFLKSYQGARMEGFDNINVDLINCLPLQTLKTWKKTLRTVTQLRPDHISVYNLILEDGTPFYKMYEQGLLKLPDEDEQAEIDGHTEEFLKAQGYVHYEVSNWAKPGRECLHNCGYWTGKKYIGLGLGAASCFGGVRWNDTRSMEEYLSCDMESSGFDPRDVLWKDIHELSRKESAEEFMYLGLRMLRGVSGQDFFARFGLRIDQVYGEQLRKAMNEGLMEREEGRYRFTPRGMAVSNRVLSEFLLDGDI